MMFSVESNSLQTNVGKITKLNNRIKRIYCDFEEVKHRVDWDIMGEAQLETKVNRVMHQIDTLSKGFNDVETTLQNIEDEYMAAYKEIKGLVNGLPNNVNQLSIEDIGKIIGSISVPSIFSGLGQIFGPVRDWFGGVIDDTSEGANKFLGFDIYGKAEGSGPGYEFIKEADLKMDSKNVYAKGALGVDGYLANGEVEGAIGLLGGEAEVSVIGGSVKGIAELSFLEDGKFKPALELGGEAEAHGLKGEAEGRFGNEDYNVHVGGTGYVGVAEAEGGIQFNKDGVEVGAEVGAAVLKGEAKGGFTFLGITIDATVEGEALGIGAGAGFKAEKDSVEIFGKLSAFLGAGVNLKISW